MHRAITSLKSIIIHPIAALVHQTVTHALVEPSAQLVNPAITSLKSIINAIAHVPEQHIRIHLIAALVRLIVTHAPAEPSVQLVHLPITSLKSTLSAIAHAPQEHT